MSGFYYRNADELEADHDMVDAIREILGLEPLWRDDHGPTVAATFPDPDHAYGSNGMRRRSA